MNADELRKKTGDGVSRIQLNTYKTILDDYRAVESSGLDAENVFRVTMSKPDFHSDSYFDKRVARAIRQGESIGLEYRGTDEDDDGTTITFRREQ